MSDSKVPSTPVQAVTALSGGKVARARRTRLDHLEKLAQETGISVDAVTAVLAVLAECEEAKRAERAAKRATRVERDAITVEMGMLDITVLGTMPLQELAAELVRRGVELRANCPSVLSHIARVRKQLLLAAPRP